jgi:mono/diheme cytochrome c family protein
MNRFFCFLALAALPAPGQVGSIALYYQFQHQHSSVLFDSIKQETTAILSPVGLRIQWKALPSTGNDVSSDLAVVTFEGRCTTQDLQSSVRPDGRLGFSHVSDKSVLPFAVIDCDSIGGFLQKKLPVSPIHEREMLFGRALARVLVHELDHIFAQTTNHGEREVDQPTYTVEELLADTVQPVNSRFHILRTAQKVLPETKGSPRTGQSIFDHSGCAACHGTNAEGTRRGPVLRAAGKFVTAVVLITRLARDEQAMTRRAHSLKLPEPVLSEEEIQDVVSFLNALPFPEQHQ